MALVFDNVGMEFHSERADCDNVLEGISFVIEKGEFVCLLGASGCGKTTLLNLVAGLIFPSTGSVTLDDTRITAPGSDRSYIFQEAALFPWLNVIDNVKFAMKMQGASKSVQEEKAEHYLDMVKLSDYKKHRIHEISGGMKQRVALARALTIDSEILLMDEPFAALDNHTKGEMRKHLLEIWEITKKTIIFVTHSIEEAFTLADKVVLFTSRPATIKKIYELSRPRDLKSSDYTKMMDEVETFLSSEVE
jgi:NitT/TauT family transport system ATP-binding protein